MSWVATAIVGSAVIGGYAANRAAGKQADASGYATDEQRRQFDITDQNARPFREAGVKALGQFATENDVPLDPSKVQMDPGYQWGLSQGQQAIDRKAAAGGGRISGASLKAAAQYGNDYATTKYDAAYNRTNQARADRLNRLAALAGIGQTATGQVATAGSNAANSISNIATAQGNAAGAATIAQGNIWSGAGNQLAALYGRGGGGGGSSGADFGFGSNPGYSAGDW